MEGNLTRKEFDIMDALIAADKPLSQRQLQERTPYSLSTINRVVKDLTEKGCVADGAVTPKGLEAMQPYRVKRAIFIAAGFGSRLVPVTLNTPKPLVRVGGQRIIDGLLDACLAAEIEEIYLVRGYLAEQFDLLLNKYPMIRFLENPHYNEANNISSAMIARDFFSNAYVFEADLLIHNPSIVKKYQYASNYLGIPVERSDDWCVTTKNGRIVSFGQGGLDCYQVVGISYWTKEDGEKLRRHIQEVYEMPGGREKLWDNVPLTVFRDEYDIEVRECTMEDIVEIDTFRELKMIDKTYDV